MKLLCKLLAALAVLYIVASLVLSAVYAAADDPWEVATHRNGCFIAVAIDNGVAVLSPLSNYGDDYIAVIRW